MNLREEAIEAIRDAMLCDCPACSRKAGLALDGLVAYLREHLESWLDEAYLPKQGSGLLPDVDDLLAVLEKGDS